MSHKYMNFLLVLVIISCSFQLDSAQCPDGKVVGTKCKQACQFDDCICNATKALNNSYRSCSQECAPPKCSEGTMICEAENCTQTCRPGECEMKCQARQSCQQDAYHGVKKVISCSAKQCTQNCKGGGCKNMYCDGENCLQTCDEGGCLMNCTASVKVCIQSCTAKTDCTLECRAENCKQSCSGPKCIILNKNSGLCVVPVNFLVYVPALVAMTRFLW